MGGSQPTREPEWDPNYWRMVRKEVVYNRGKISHRTWEGTAYNGAKHDQGTDQWTYRGA